ncbi:MAG TPA: hypothetical protein VFF73_34045, partial [Planctomycetota bacterium]|nr:hypothetical protein [Planctomycetota bacterium]
MSDAEYRELERTALAGDRAAQAKHLVARVRAGKLPQEMLELAAHVGDPIACMALGKSPVATTELLDWMSSLAPWGVPVQLRALVAAVRALEEPLPEDIRIGPGRSDATIRATLRWCSQPSDELARAAWDAGQRFDRSIYNNQRILGNPGRMTSFAVPTLASIPLRASAGMADQVQSRVREVLRWVERFVSPNVLLDRMRASLIAFAIGEQPPVVDVPVSRETVPPGPEVPPFDASVLPGLDGVRWELYDTAYGSSPRLPLHLAGLATARDD